MYNLALHIEYLLLHHDCVVLPSVGAFINVRHSARFDEAEGKWIPMTREVRFNSALKHDDGLLATSYARKNGIDFSRSRSQVREDINKLKTTLEEDGEVTIGRLGILMNNDGAFSFKPLLQPLQTAAEYGYVCIPVTHTALETTRPLERKTSSRVAGFDTERNYYIKVNKVFARSIACLLLITTILLSVFLPGANREKIDKASVVPLENVIVSRIQELSESVREEKSLSLDKNNEESDVELLDDTEASPNYYAIVGTFKTSSEADRFIRSNENTEYPLGKVETSTRVRIYAFKSTDKESLASQMQVAEFKERFPQSWIWQEEKK